MTSWVILSFRWASIHLLRASPFGEAVHSSTLEVTLEVGSADHERERNVVGNAVLLCYVMLLLRVTASDSE